MPSATVVSEHRGTNFAGHTQNKPVANAAIPSSRATALAKAADTAAPQSSHATAEERGVPMERGMPIETFLHKELC